MRMHVVAALAVAVLAAGCAGRAPGGSEDLRLQVVTTVAPITNIAANVAGDLVRIEGIVPQGEDSHEFEPSPSVARTLAAADLVFVNGLHLEEPTIELARANLSDGAKIVELAEQTISQEEYIFDFSFPLEQGSPNPHLWTNPPYAKRYAELVMQELSAAAPEHAGDFRGNFKAFAIQVDELDTALRTATETVAPERRKLLTYHDSFPYFARDYGWTVIGAIQPSDFSEPTPREVAALIDHIRNEQVPAIFGSEVFPSPVLEQIARESGALYVEDLRDDELPGDPGTDRHSWLGLMVFDYVTIVEALGGDASALKAIEVRNIVSDKAIYR